MDELQKQALLEKVSRQLIDEGRLIEAGWQAFRAMTIPPHASDTQLREMRKAFFIGAQHLFASIMTMMEPGKEETPADLARMGHISAELARFMQDLMAELATTDEKPHEEPR